VTESIDYPEQMRRDREEIARLRKDQEEWSKLAASQEEEIDYLLQQRDQLLATPACRRVSHSCSNSVRLELALRQLDKAAAEIERLRAQRDQLLAALEQALDDMGNDYCVCEDTKQMLRDAHHRAAIAAVEDRE
jgi:hypothetical protein